MMVYHNTLSARASDGLPINTATKGQVVHLFSCVGTRWRVVLRLSDYAVAGTTNVLVVDAHRFWVNAYVEETKLPGVRPGAATSIKLMGFAPLLEGHVASIGRGIAEGNELRSEGGLPQVAPTFSWIRLAQWVPVRIALDTVPPGVELAAGMMATTSWPSCWNAMAA